MYKIIHVDLFMFECMTSSLWHSLYKEVQSQYHLLAISFSPAVSPLRLQQCVYDLLSFQRSSLIPI